MPEKAVKSNAAATWPKSILKDLEGIVTVLMAAFMLARGRAASSGSAIVRALAGQHEYAWDAALLKREAAVLRGSRERVPAQTRPHYAPVARFEIIQIMRLRHWNIQTAAERFAIHPNTLRTWLKDMNLRGNESRFFKPPINRISEAGRWVVHQIRESCPEPEFGTRSIAMCVVRLGKKMSRSSAQRILREKKPAPPPMPARSQDGSSGEPHHILRPKEINRTWHLDLTTLDFLFARFYVAAVVDGFSRKLLALRVYRDAPSTRNMLALVKNCVKEFGAPKFLVTDHGTQFRGKFKTALKRMNIALVKGNKDRSKQFNGKAERFFKSFRIWQRLTLFAHKKDWIQRRLDVFRNWYNEERPMWLHGARTPEEVWSAITLPAPTPMLARDPIRPAVNIQRIDYRGDIHLPTFSLTIIDSVKRIA